MEQAPYKCDQCGDPGAVPGTLRRDRSDWVEWRCDGCGKRCGFQSIENVVSIA